ncbi:UNVERIFIED_ORG: branched-chain amino acid transport system substrate-binding protein [Xanthobacter viscosus]|uniref:ABC transporter substrate-binding protein n=1 Tax=Xanthobacter autotrophicus TaxID=280 RepID=A0A6C1KAS8_XANAU|nr:ABC transporter substrate-binding protein [Xanthobacter autotrophicus]TLX41409.1 ABC transporter substrate-binding protein [Xanthobacter autotrophicus]
MRITIATAAALLGVLLSGAPGACLAQEQRLKVRIGVLTDLSGPFADFAGKGSVIATQMAVDDCLKAECKGMQVEVIAADHQNKADIALGIARKWIDTENVDVIGDVVNAAVQLAVQSLARERQSFSVLFPGGTARLTNEDCSPDTSVQWMWDTYSQVAGAVKPLAKPGTKWFFLASDYAFGHSLQKDGTEIINAQSAQVVGAVRHPFQTSDFSSFLLQAQASSANFVAFANAGTDATASIRQASEFGLQTSGKKPVALFLTLPDVKALGLAAAAGTQLTESFYWNVDDRTRTWSSRFAEVAGSGKMPSISHAGAYSATRHYLKAVAALRSKAPKAVTAKMREIPVEDDIVRNATLRPDGRLVHDTYLLQVKTPQQSKSEWDVYNVIEVIPGEQAFRPLSQSACPAIRKAG